MADIAEVDVPTNAKRSKLVILAPILTALLGGIGGYYIVNSEPLKPTESTASKPEPLNRTAPTSEITDLAFVPLDPIIVSFSSGNDRQLLKFVGNLEVDQTATAEVELLKPRIIDILNEYLRALELNDLEEPAALLKIRSQLLHRVRIVAGEDRVKDLLIIEFVIN